jgi:hypothetical protein
MSTYPTLRLGVLQALIELKGYTEQHPDALRAKECPYDQETIQALELIFKTRVVEKIVEKVVEKEVRGRGRPTGDTKLSMADQEDVESSATELLAQLQALGEGEKGLDTSTKIQIIKTKATLIEQLLKLRERWFNVKRVAQFQIVVIGILDDLLAEGDRQEFLKRVEPYRE